MSESLPTLRKHEAALGVIRRVTADTLNQRNGPRATAMYSDRVGALDYALARLREDIAEAEEHEAKKAAECPSCAGSGEQISWSSLRDYDKCRNCNGTGQRKEGER